MFAILFALLAGLATVAAPCTLPVLPIILGTAIGGGRTIRPLFIALGFVSTFSAAALLLGEITRLADVDPERIRQVAIFLLLGFGILMLIPDAFERLTARLGGTRFHVIRIQADGSLGGFVLGMTLGLVWTPCAGPVLGSILTLIATEQQRGLASLLLLAYAIGAALPMIAIAYGGDFVVSRVRAMARLAPWLQKGFGALVVASALLMLFQYDTLVVSWLSHFYPAGQTGL